MGSFAAHRAGLFVLVGGFPASGKTTLATALASELRLPLLAKDAIKEVLADQLCVPTTVEESQGLGQTAVRVMLRVAQSCPGAVLDSTWFDYTAPLLSTLPGVLIEIRCEVPLGVARARYQARTGQRHTGHLDHLRTDSELWRQPSRPVGARTTLVIDTTRPINAQEIATQVWRAADPSSAG